MSKTLLDFSIDQEIISDYQFGLTSREVAVKHNIGKTTVLRILSKYGIEKRRRRLPDELRLAVVKEYESGSTSNAIAAKHGILPETVRKILVENKVVVSRGRALKRKEVFSSLNHRTAYWMGFIYADGCISDEGRFSLEVSQKDAEHVEKLSKITGIPVYRRKTRETVCMEAIDKEFINLFSVWGICPRKSKNYIPPCFPSVLFLPYFLGVIDGDGWVKYPGKTPKSKTFEISVTGNRLFLVWLQQQLERLEISASTHKLDADKIWGTLNIANKQHVLNLLDLFTPFKDLMLPRKVLSFYALPEVIDFLND